MSARCNYAETVTLVMYTVALKPS